MRGSTSVGYDQFETSSEAIEQELRPAVCERRPTDRLKANYSIYYNYTQYCHVQYCCGCCNTLFQDDLEKGQIFIKKHI